MSAINFRRPARTATAEIADGLESSRPLTVEEIVVGNFYPARVSWDDVRRVANALTNQLYIADSPESPIDFEKYAYVAYESYGGRSVEFEPGAHRVENEYWYELAEKEVSKITWTSATSGNTLTARKVATGSWELVYAPGPDPLYRGAYYRMYMNPEGVPELDPEYVYQNRRLWN